MRIDSTRNGIIARDGGCVVVAKALCDITLTSQENTPSIVVCMGEDIKKELLSLVDNGSATSVKETNELINPHRCIEQWNQVLNACCKTEDYQMALSDERVYHWRVTITMCVLNQDSGKLEEVGLAACVAALENIDIPCVAWDEAKQWWRTINPEGVMEEHGLVWRQTNSKILSSIPIATSLFQTESGEWTTRPDTKEFSSCCILTRVVPREDAASQRYMLNFCGTGLRPSEIASIFNTALEASSASFERVFDLVKSSC